LDLARIVHFGNYRGTHRVVKLLWVVLIVRAIEIGRCAVASIDVWLYRD
jgi:hypothetical protein